MATKVKICGIRTPEAALAATREGADFLGLNFVTGFRRSITLSQAENIVAALPASRPKLVGVFMDQSLETIQNITKQLPLDYIQLHGNESPGFAAALNLPIIKVFSLEPEFDPQTALLAMKAYDVDLYMVDRAKRGQGEPLDPTKVRLLSDHFRVMLAGGLTPDNVSAAIQAAQPFAVDVAGGIEIQGEADTQKIKVFINKAKIA